MNKCSICNSKKGERTCWQFTGSVCSKCCGTNRSEVCDPCQYFKPLEDQKFFRKVPRFEISETVNNDVFIFFALVFETTILSFDRNSSYSLKDREILALLKILIYQWNDLSLEKSNQYLDPPQESSNLERTLKTRLVEYQKSTNASPEFIVKGLNTILFVANRRTRGQREYIDFLREQLPENDFMTHEGLPLPINKILEAQKVEEQNYDQLKKIEDKGFGRIAIVGGKRIIVSSDIEDDELRAIERFL